MYETDYAVCNSIAEFESKSSVTRHEVNFVSGAVLVQRDLFDSALSASMTSLVHLQDVP